LNLINHLQYKISKSKYFFYHLITFNIIATSGISLFTIERNFLIFFTLLTFFIYVALKIKFDRIFISQIILLLVIALGVYVKFGAFEINSTISIILKFSLAYFTVKILKGYFFISYINLIYIFSIISLLFFIPGFISNDIWNFESEIIKKFAVDNYEWKGSIIIYNIEYKTIRNSGPFWEAGAFSIFLNIALMFNTMISRKFLNRKNYIFIITNITTFSTGGFLTLIIFSIIFLKYELNKYKKIIIFPLIVLFVVYSYFSFDFLGRKIEEQFLSQVYAKDRYTNLGRFQSAILDLKDITTSPIFGRGRDQFRYTKVENYYYEEYGAARRSNGITDYIVKMGIPFSLLYFLLLYNSFSKFVKWTNYPRAFAVYFFLLMLIMAFSQLIFTYPFFISLIFLPNAITSKNIYSNYYNKDKFKNYIQKN